MNLSDLFSAAALTERLEAGLVRLQTHETAPLAILNYTEAAQYARAWDDVTLTCRGLIYNTETFDVVARPFPKFFNHDEPEAAAAIALDGPVTVTDKLDGSLGILYHDGTDWAIATRGSFESVQAKHATEVYRARYADHWQPHRGWTYLFEVVYPENRIVVDYDDLDDLILLGAVSIVDGYSYGPDELPEWPGTGAETFEFDSLAEALAAEPRPNAEGYVVHYWKHDVRVKIKQDDYKALHRIVTGWNERTIWEQLKAGATECFAELPDEFHRWAETVATDLETRHTALYLAAITESEQIVAALPEGWGRKDYALAIKDRPDRAALFLALDNHTTRLADWAWDQIKPAAGGYATLTPKEPVAS